MISFWIFCFQWLIVDADVGIFIYCGLGMDWSGWKVKEKKKKKKKSYYPAGIYVAFCIENIMRMEEREEANMQIKSVSSKSHAKRPCHASSH